MLKRDFIMVQIEELGRVIAQIIFNRNSNDGARERAIGIYPTQRHYVLIGTSGVAGRDK